MCRLLTFSVVTDAKYEVSQNKKMYIFAFRYMQVMVRIFTRCVI